MRENIMDEERKQAWKGCLILWESLSTLPSYNTGIYCSPKSDLLDKLGFGQMENSCPFCDKYYKGLECRGCPISNVLIYSRHEVACRTFGCPYREYSDEIINTGYHKQEIAEAFYKWLIKLAKQEGYVPDFNLKYW